MSAQKVEKVYVEGRVGKSTRSVGEFEDRQEPGRMVTYDFTEVKIVSDDDDVAVVRFPSVGSEGARALPLPERGEQVRYTCDARVAGGAVKLTAEHRHEFTYGELLAALRAGTPASV